jgi:hypothetical protein
LDLLIFSTHRLTNYLPIRVPVDGLVTERTSTAVGTLYTIRGVENGVIISI